MVHILKCNDVATWVRQQAQKKVVVSEAFKSNLGVSFKETATRVFPGCSSKKGILGHGIHASEWRPIK